MISLGSLWSRLHVEWQHWRLKHIDHLKTQCFRVCCWIIRSFKNDRVKYNSVSIADCNPDWRIDTVDGWRMSAELLFPQRAGALRRAVFCDISNQWALYHRTAGDGSGLKQWALSHYIASLGWWHGGRGWLAKDDGSMMVVSITLLKNQSTSQKGLSLRFPLVAGRSNGCFCMVPCLPDLRCQCFVQSPTSTNEKRKAL